jgi:NADH dehydrogenase FAD-containing subunit
VTDSRIVAAGDSAAPSDLPVRMSCQAAMQVGPQAAETVLSRIAGQQPAPVEVGFAGQCVSLGRRAGIFQVSRRDDAATRYFLGGRPGARLKELICRSIIWQLGFEARHPGAVRLRVKDPTRRQRLRAEPGDIVAR